MMYCNTTKSDGDQPTNSGVTGYEWVCVLGFDKFQKSDLNINRVKQSARRPRAGGQQANLD